MTLIVRGQRLDCGGRSFACVIGRGGFALTKKEGDGATPVGVFPLRRLYYRADRLAAPATGLPRQPLQPDDGWCDAPGDSAYNRPVRHPYPAPAEHLWRDDGVYDLIVVIGHNDRPVIAGAGSAIFLHCARPDRRPTEGCIALARDDLLSVLEFCDTKTSIDIGS